MENNGTNLYKLWQKRRNLRWKLLLVLLLCSGLSLWLRPYVFPTKTAAPILPDSNPTSAPSTTPTSGSLVKGTPDYPTITPTKKSVEWTRVSPPSHNPVFAYVDTIGGIPITVSEQPLPEAFNNDTDNQLQGLAKDYNANRFITVENAKVYIGTSTKGPQSLILSKKSLLILIKSTSALNDEQWSTYIKSLN